MRDAVPLFADRTHQSLHASQAKKLESELKRQAELQAKLDAAASQHDNMSPNDVVANILLQTLRPRSDDKKKAPKIETVSEQDLLGQYLKNHPELAKAHRLKVVRGRGSLEHCNRGRSASRSSMKTARSKSGGSQKSQKSHKSGGSQKSFKSGGSRRSSQRSRSHAGSHRSSSHHSKTSSHRSRGRQGGVRYDSSSRARSKSRPGDKNNGRNRGKGKGKGKGKRIFRSHSKRD